jgi:hypothetical protein
MAAPAHVITLGIEADINANIRAWFKQFNYLPPIPLTAGHVDTVTAHISFENLLQRMADSAFRNFILIIHGHEDGSGLFLDLAPFQKKRHTEHWDLQKLMDIDSGASKMGAADKARMGITDAQIKNILALMHKVQKKNIECVEFRSCNLGKNTMSLGRFRKFFGARVAGAPDLHTLFGYPRTWVGTKFVQKHLELHAGGYWETYKFPHAFGDPQLVCCFQLNELKKPEKGGHVIADTAGTLDAWIKQFVMAGGGLKGRDLPMHGLWIADRKVARKDPRDPPYLPVRIEVETKDPLGTWGNDVLPVRRFIPAPSENYKSHIVYSR